MTDFLLYLIQVIPLAFIIGIATACIGYTAWAIIVPLAFVGFGLGIFDAIVISLLIDFVNSLILTTTYSRQDKVDFKQGSKWGLIAIIGAISGAFLAVILLTQFEDLLRGSIGYAMFLLAAFFIYRGYNIGKKDKKLGETQLAENPKTPLSKNMIITIMIVGFLISGFLSGLIGMGSGTNYTLLFLFLYGKEKGFDTLRSAGTGNYIMCIVTISLVIFFSAFQLVNFSDIGPYLIASLIPAAVGTIIGASIALRISESKLNYLVGVTIFIAALAGSIQSVIL